MNLQDVFYHGIRSQISRVLDAMTDAEIDRGLTAFVDGQKNWSHCFFARACPDLMLDHGHAERKLQQHLGIPTPIPIRIVYCTFDGVGVAMKRDELEAFIKSFRTADGGVSPEVEELLKSIDYSKVETQEIGTVCGPSDDQLWNDMHGDEPSGGPA